VRLRLDLGYDGTEFSGWARQPDRRTVEQTLEEALQAALRLSEPARLTVAGRTDAGVHARGQVVHVDVPGEPWQGMRGRLVSRLQSLLPADVRVSAVAEAPGGFDARFAATSRRYSYRVSDDPGGVDPVRRRDVLWNARQLDALLMNQAAQRLLGEHDFASYCRRREGATTIRRLLEFSWTRLVPGIIEARVVADAFCHNMVRALVGASLAVGEGRRPAEWPSQVLAETSRSSSVMVVPGLGLILEEVTYPPDEQLAGRVGQTRRRRS
jgi:tRNA pseudouridine38-40 synthase